MRPNEMFYNMLTIRGTYSVGGNGPNGTYVFYDKGSYSNGWRYIAAYPIQSKFGLKWSNSDTLVGTENPNTTIAWPYIDDSNAAIASTVGDSKTNTDLIINVFGSQSCLAGLARYYGASGGNGTYSTHMASVGELYWAWRNNVPNILWGIIHSSNEGWSSPTTNVQVMNNGGNGQMSLLAKSNTGGGYYLPIIYF